MTDQELMRLEDLAKQATKGEWEDCAVQIVGRSVVQGVCAGKELVCSTEGNMSQHSMDAEYIAAANPAAILRLIVDYRAALDYARAQVPGWINVDERLPEECDLVQVFTVRGNIGIAHMEVDMGGSVAWSVASHLPGAGYLDVTHWMPLPAAPIRKEEKCDR